MYLHLSNETAYFFEGSAVKKTLFVPLKFLTF